jgi:hypothetical protein
MIKCELAVKLASSHHFNKVVYETDYFKVPASAC